MASSVWYSKACYNMYVRDALVTGFAERKDGRRRHYDFVVEVLWSDGSKAYVKRTYKDFLELREIFCKHGKKSGKHYERSWSDENVPRLEGMPIFTSSGVEQAERQETELNRFLQTLAKTRGELMYSKELVEFFEPREHDPVPHYRNSEIDELSELDGVAIEDEVVFDVGKWRNPKYSENSALLDKKGPR